MCKRYTWHDLSKLCIREKWFDCGTNEQYDKLRRAFYDGVDERELAYLIWICSDTDELRGDFDDQITAIEDIIAEDMGE